MQLLSDESGPRSIVLIEVLCNQVHTYVWYSGCWTTWIQMQMEIRTLSTLVYPIFLEGFVSVVTTTVPLSG